MTWAFRAHLNWIADRRRQGRRFANRSAQRPEVERLEDRDAPSVTPTGPTVRVDEATLDTGSMNRTVFANRTVAIDAAGDFVVTWESYQQNSQNSSNAIFARRYDAAGVPEGDQFQVNTFTAGTVQNPSVAMDAAGDFVIAWTAFGESGVSQSNGGPNEGIFARRYNANGTPQGAEFRVNALTNFSEVSPDVAMDAAGDFAIAWAGYDFGGPNDTQPYLQRFNSAGVAQGGESIISSPAGTSFQSGPFVAMDATGDYALAVGYGSPQSPLQSVVYVQTFDAAGSPLEPPVQVNVSQNVTSGYSYANLARPIAMDAAGDFIVPWVELVTPIPSGPTSPSGSTSTYGDYAQRFNRSGEPQGGVISASVRNNGYPFVAMDAEGESIISNGPFAQRYNSSGVLQSGPGGGIQFGLPLDTPADAVGLGFYSSVAMDAAGDFVLAGEYQFQLSSGGLSTTEVVAQKYVRSLPSISANDVTISADSGSQVVSGWATYNPGPDPASQLTTDWIPSPNIPSPPAPPPVVENYTVTNVNNPGLFSVPPSVAADGTLTYTPATGVSGTSTFDVQVHEAGGLNNLGYDDGTVQTFTITVVPNVLTVAADSLTLLAGSNIPTLAYTATGFVGSDTAALVLTGHLSTPATPGSPPGDYPVQQGTLTSRADYTIEFTPGTLTVVPPEPPTITSAASALFTVNTAGTISLTATGTPVPTFSETGALPSGLAFSSTGVLSGTPTAGSVGIYPITITVSNGVSPDATQSFVLKVLSPVTQDTLVTGSNQAGLSNEVKLYNADGTLMADFQPFSPGFTGPVNVTIGDINGDGVPDVIVAAGFSGGPEVKIFNGSMLSQLQGDAAVGAGSPALIADFYAYSPQFTGGVNVAVGDVNGDGVPDIIVGAGYSGGPHVKIFDGSKLAQLEAGTPVVLTEFFAFDSSFRGGVSVAVGRLDGTGKYDVITGAGAGGGPGVRVWAIANGGSTLINSPLADFFAFSPSFLGGVTVAAGDFEGLKNGTDDLAVGAGSAGAPEVKVYRPSGQLVNDFFASFGGSSGVSLASGDVAGQGFSQLILRSGNGSGTTVVLDPVDLAQLDSFFS